MNSKNKLRHEIAKAYANADLHAYAQSAVARIAKNRDFLRSKYVLAYEPMKDEIPFIHTLRDTRNDKKWFFTETENNCFSDATGNIWTPDTALDTVALVPSRAVTLSGIRLGRGGGWYDKYFQNIPEVVRLTVVPKFAVLDSLPQEAHDVSVTEVIVATVE